MSLDLQEQIDRIDRAIIEGHKFAAQTQKLTAEAMKVTWDMRSAP